MKTSASIWLGIGAVLWGQFTGNAVLVSLPYTPATDPGVFEWLKADSLNQSSNSPISSWPASAGLAMVNPLSVSQPLFNPNQQNGLPAVQFTGASFLSTSSTFSPVQQPFTALIVFQYLDPSAATEALLSGGPSGNDVRIANFNNNSFSAYAGSGNYSTGGPTSDGNWHVAMFVFNGSSSKYRMDGGSDTPFGSSPGSNAINSIFLGENVLLGPSSRFNLGELVIYQGDQSTNEAAIFGYETNRWAILPPLTTSAGGPLTAAASNATGSVNMIWSPVSTAVGYTLYWGTASGNYNQMISGASSQTNLVAAGLVTNGVYYLAVTATAADGTESPYSAEVVYTNGMNSAGVAPPTNLHIAGP